VGNDDPKREGSGTPRDARGGHEPPSEQAERGAAPALDSLAGGVVHELNNILGIVLGNAELASMDPGLSSSVRKSLEEITKAGRHGIRLVEQILALRRGRTIAADPNEWKTIAEDLTRILRASLPDGIGVHMSVTGAHPAGTPEAAASRPSDSRPNAGAEARGSILYLDDEEAMVNLASRMLRGLGYRVSGFVQPEKALSALKENPSGFDLVVTDYNMPRISGLQVAAETSMLRSDLPVMVTSGYVTDEMREKAREAGVRHLVAKPGSMDEMCAIIEDALRSGRP